MVILIFGNIFIKQCQPNEIFYLILYKMKIIVSENGRHTLDDHPENKDRLDVVVGRIMAQKLDFISIDDNGDDLVKYIPKNALNELRRKGYKCPKCKNRVHFCKKCNQFGIVEDQGNDLYHTVFSLKEICNLIYSLNEGCKYINAGEYFCYLLTRPPGHHADENPSGFCFINSAFYAASMLKNYGFEQIGIFDWDYHFGDGTYNLVKDKRWINFCSIHAYGKDVYPGGGEFDPSDTKNLNIPLKIRNNNDNEGKKRYDNDYLKSVFDISIFPFFQNCNVDVLIISNGLDAHREDSIAGLNVDEEFYRYATRRLISLNIPMMFILEGGYNPYVIADVSMVLINLLLEFS